MGKIYNIPPGVSLIDSLAYRLYTECKYTPLKLADYLILLPTRRACRNLRTAFLQVSQGQALILPQIKPIGDINEDELQKDLLLTQDHMLFSSLDLPEAIQPMERLFLLAEQIRRFEVVSGDDRNAIRESPSPHQAIHMARALIRLWDDALIEGVNLDDLEDLAPNQVEEYWRQIIEFLDIIREHWPKILESMDKIDPVERRNRLIRALCEVWQTNPPKNPVIIAGSTGSQPATRELMKTVYQYLPEGSILLPGMMTEYSQKQWSVIHETPSHPQHIIARLLSYLDIEAEAVPLWLGDQSTSGKDAEITIKPTIAARLKLMHLAFMPQYQASNKKENGIKDNIDMDEIHQLHRIDVPDQASEAGVIALLMRETLETPGKTCALVTSDQVLAERVEQNLKAWDTEVDNSSGHYLADSSLGMFMRLIPRLIARSLSAINLMAILSHPFCSLGLRPQDCRNLARLLEKNILRGQRLSHDTKPSLTNSIDDLIVKVKTYNHFSENQKNQLEGLLLRFIQALAPLEGLAGNKQEEISLSQWVKAHIQTAEALAMNHEEDGAWILWRGLAGEGLSSRLSELLQVQDYYTDIAIGEYEFCYDALTHDLVIRPVWQNHPRLFIWGPLEARVIKADRVILGSFNEGFWPRGSTPDPWMSRGMREKLGLHNSEYRVGQQAHDFIQTLSADEVFITRAERDQEKPSLPSRWLFKLDVALELSGHKPQNIQIKHYYTWLKKFKYPSEIKAHPPPSPKPPIEARPRKVAVTRLGDWVSNPYAFYGHSILKLYPEEDLDPVSSARDRGNIIHHMLEVLIKNHPPSKPLPTLDESQMIVDQTLGQIQIGAGQRIIWRMGLMALLAKVIQQEKIRRERDRITQSLSEIKGQIEIDTKSGFPFILTAKADRVDMNDQGHQIIIDYKSGTTPSKKDMKNLTKPQMPLEILIAEKGGFTSRSSPDAEGRFWKINLLKGEVSTEDVTLDANKTDRITEGLEEKLRDLIALFDDPETAYLAYPDPQNLSSDYMKYDRYKHLARRDEWLSNYQAPSLPKKVQDE